MINNTLDKMQSGVENAAHNVAHTFDRKDTHSYKGWLNSDSFLKRSFAVLGYNTVASLIIMIPVYALLFAGALFFFSMMGKGDMHADMGSRGMRYDKEFSGQYKDLNIDEEYATSSEASSSVR